MKKHLTYYLWVYIVYAIVAIAISLTVFQQIKSIDENEKITIFFAGQGVETSIFEDDALTNLKQTSRQDIKQISLEYLDPELLNFDEILATRSLGGTDVFILPESAVKTNTGSAMFLPVNSEDLIDNFGSDIEIYYENGIAYGVYLNEVDNRFTSYLAEGDPNRYIVFFSIYGVNLGELNAYSNLEDVAAIELIWWLLNEV